jgi:hypothetical protein
MANTTPIFTIIPRVGMVRISTANTGRDGSGTTGDVITGATSGTRIDRIVITATGTTTAGMVRLFIYDGSANTRAWKEVVVTAITVAASTPAFTATIVSPDLNSPLLVLPNAYVLRASTHNAETFDVVAHGGDY